MRRVPIVQIFDFEEESKYRLNNILLYLESSVNDIAYASMYQDNTDTTISIAATGTDYKVTGMTFGMSAGFGASGTSELICHNPGIYEVSWSLSIQGASDYMEIEGTVGIDGIRQPNVSAHAPSIIIYPLSGAEVIGVVLAGTGIIKLTSNQTVSLMIRSPNDASNTIVGHVTFVLNKIND